MRIISPEAGQCFTIAADGSMPALAFATDAPGANRWSWTITWGNYHRSGEVDTPGGHWDVRAALADLGGQLAVRVRAATAGEAAIAVRIAGTNPPARDIDSFLAQRAGAEGFARIVAQESRYRHFDARGEPVRSFDGGYGLCQLTTPAPDYAQVWSWKRNLEAGLALFAAKRAAAGAWLGQGGRAFTPAQLTREAVCRWNGGRYHVWDDAAGCWARPPAILCDARAGNIGWDMGDPANREQNEAALHRRDGAAYARPPAPGARWRYYGVCYADHVLGPLPPAPAPAPTHESEPGPALSGNRAIWAAHARLLDGLRADRPLPGRSRVAAADARTRPRG